MCKQTKCFFFSGNYALFGVIKLPVLDGGLTVASQLYSTAIYTAISVRLPHSNLLNFEDIRLSSIFKEILKIQGHNKVD